MFLLIVGLFFLAKDLGLVGPDLSFWTIAFVALGVYFLAGGSKRKSC